MQSKAKLRGHHMMQCQYHFVHKLCFFAYSLCKTNPQEVPAAYIFWVQARAPFNSPGVQRTALNRAAALCQAGSRTQGRLGHDSEDGPSALTATPLNKESNLASHGQEQLH